MIDSPGDKVDDVEVKRARPDHVGTLVVVPADYLVSELLPVIRMTVTDAVAAACVVTLVGFIIPFVIFRALANDSE